MKTSKTMIALNMLLSGHNSFKKMRILILLIFLLMPTVAFAIEKADRVLVIKVESKLYLLNKEKILGEYHVAFGSDPKGHKQLFNWTDGCIAVSNSAMDEIWGAVDVGTPIEIKP